jgi:hypothetical protein
VSNIRVVYAKEPNFPATDQHPAAVRYQIGACFVDAVGEAPTQADVDAFLAPPLPRVVTMRQARLALLSAGMLSAVSAAIAAAPGTAGDAARIEWEYAATVDRDSPLVAGLIATLGLTSEQLDTLFAAAAGL